jgi:hypothetical protein
VASLRFPGIAFQLKQVVFGLYWALSVFIRIIAFNNIIWKYKRLPFFFSLRRGKEKILEKIEVD